MKLVHYARHQFTVYSLQLTVRYPFTVFHNSWSTDHGKRMANSEWQIVNGFAGGKI